MSNKALRILVMMLATLALVSILLAACTRPGSPEANSGGGTSSGGGGATVHMNANNFVQNTVSISKGAKLTLVDDVQVEHIIANGTWNNGAPKPSQESGAPTVNVTFQGSDTMDVGPFNTAGTFQLYCTIHLGMNLTVTVK